MLTWMVSNGPFWSAGMSGVISFGNVEAMASMPDTIGSASSPKRRLPRYVSNARYAAAIPNPNAAVNSYRFEIGA